MKLSIYIVSLTVSACCLLLLGCSESNSGPNLEAHFNYKSNDPFGSKIAYTMLENNFGERLFEISNEPISSASEWWSDSGALYVNISNNFYVDKKDAGHLLNFVKNGNTAFISANVVDSNLLGQLYVKQEPSAFQMIQLKQQYTDAQTSLKRIDSFSLSNYSYFYYPFNNGFTENEATYFKQLGHSGYDKKVNVMLFFWGKGKLIIHLEPKALSNYFLLTRQNHTYFQKLMQFFPQYPGQVYWDDYYRKINYPPGDDSFSTLDTILKYPPLKWAFFSGLLLLLLYILVNGKRRQRIVPVLPKVENASIAFAEAVAGLYLKENDNKAIADKMISYFNEGVRSRYFLNSNHIDEQFLETLSKKSGIERNKVNELYESMSKINSATLIQDTELLQLNEQIQYFYKNKKG